MLKGLGDTNTAAAVTVSGLHALLYYIKNYTSKSVLAMVRNRHLPHVFPGIHNDNPDEPQAGWT